MPASNAFRPSQSTPFFRIGLFASILGCIILCFAVSMQAGGIDYPKKNIAWIVPYQPGGGYDTYSRAIAKILPKYLPGRAKILIKNMAGAGGRMGAAVLYRAKPDGYTMGIMNPFGLYGSDLVKKSTQYDISNFTYLATCSRGVPALYVATQSEFNTIEDLLKQERVSVVTGGRGSGTWLWGMLVKGIIGIPVNVISGYLGTSDYVTAVLRKDAEALVLGFSSSAAAYCLAGELKPLLVFADDPLEWMPSAPTAKGTRFEELTHFKNDRVIAAPPGLPDEIKDILEKALLEALKDPDLLMWSDETHNPIFINDAQRTWKNVLETWTVLEKYKRYLKN